jgi:hypothetical protein
MTEKHEGHTVTSNALVTKRAEILFEIGELEKKIARLQPTRSTLGEFRPSPHFMSFRLNA